LLTVDAMQHVVDGAAGEHGHSLGIMEGEVIGLHTSKYVTCQSHRVLNGPL